MKIFSLHCENKVSIALALGFFDCVHSGHRALLEQTKSRAAELGCMPCAITFRNNPYSLLGKSDKLIFTFEERAGIFENAGMEGVVAVDFNREFMQTDKLEFLEMLRSSFSLKAVVCGHDYKFGAGASGNVEYLQKYCNNFGIMCDIIQPIEQDLQRISSTSVRSLISSGEIEAATKLLGHEYFAEGVVCHGRGVGRLFDFPTANLGYSSDKLLPKCGVYATRTVVDGKSYKSVTNVGGKPTFSETDFSVETMLIDFSGDLYGKTVRIDFVRYLRDIRKFSSPYELKTRIYKDAEWR